MVPTTEIVKTHREYKEVVGMGIGIQLDGLRRTRKGVCIELNCSFLSPSDLGYFEVFVEDVLVK